MEWPIALLYWLAVTLGADHGVNPCVIKGVIWTESRWNVYATSPDGTNRGLGQISEWLWLRFDVDPYAPQGNLHAVAHHLGELHDKYGDWDWALAGYNAGVGAVTVWHGPPPFTLGYISKVKQHGLASRWQDECKEGWPR
jgi:soluble lytic murein transglycosylase-like protein